MVRTGKGDRTRYGEMVVPIFLIFMCLSVSGKWEIEFGTFMKP